MLNEEQSCKYTNLSVETVLFFNHAKAAVSKVVSLKHRHDGSSRYLLLATYQGNRDRELIFKGMYNVVLYCHLCVASSGGIR